MTDPDPTPYLRLVNLEQSGFESRLLDPRLVPVIKSIDVAEAMLRSGDNEDSPLVSVLHYGRAMEASRAALLYLHHPEATPPSVLREMRPLSDFGIIAEINEHIGHDCLLEYTRDQAMVVGHMARSLTSAVMKSHPALIKQLKIAREHAANLHDHEMSTDNLVRVEGAQVASAQYGNFESSPGLLR